MKNISGKINIAEKNKNRRKEIIKEKNRRKFSKAEKKTKSLQNAEQD